jgi:Stigma-specific protein, Stig1
MRIHLILVLVLSALPAVPAAALGRAGGCQSRCPSGQRMCTHENGSATCVDLDRDPRHCGRCGNVCRKQDRCIDGRCEGAGHRCERGQSYCQMPNGTQRCTDTGRDEQNCGRCGNVCRKQDRCIDGRCEGAEHRCERGQSYCQMPNGTQRCTDTGRDEQNCGRCGNVCRKQEKCINGACSSDCPPGHTFCRRPDGTYGCINTQIDRLNCGGCGQDCPSIRPTCREGRCH